MKKILHILITVLFIAQVSNAQSPRLWTMAEHGGTMGYGTILSADITGTNFAACHNFDQVNGSMPVGGLCEASNGKLYCVTYLGGYGDSCIIGSLDPYTGHFDNIYDFFQYTQYGWDAWSGMTNGADGMLYGLCAYGGANGAGVIYKVDPSTDIYTDVFDMTGTTGGYALGTLLLLSDGKLYGMTSGGGSMSEGAIFSYDPATDTYLNLHNFNGTNGMSPRYGGLVLATDGKLYGMTYSGHSTETGMDFPGVIFSFDPSTQNYVDLYHFDGTHGGNPMGSLMQATDGLLYGMTNGGGALNQGVIFSWDINTHTYSDIFDFNGTDGARPERSLMQASSGKLFGTTAGGGAGSMGVVFNYDINTGSYTKLIDLNNSTGTTSSSDVLETIMATTGIAELNATGKMNVYPNPAKNSVTIEAGNTMLQVFDVLGRNIANVKSSITGKTIVDITNYPNIFFVKNQSGVVVKVVKD